MESEVCAGVYPKALNLKWFYRLFDGYNVFQVKISAFKKANILINDTATHHVVIESANNLVVRL